MAGTNEAMLERARKTAVYWKYGREEGRDKLIKAPLDIVRYTDGTYLEPCHLNVVQENDAALANHNEALYLASGAGVPIDDFMIIEPSTMGGGDRDDILALNQFSVI